MTESTRRPPFLSRRLLGAVLLLGISGCAKPVDAPPASVVFFTAFSPDLDGPALQVIDHVAADAQANPRRNIWVSGFADRTGTTPAQNRTLAEQRAQAVADALASHGINRSRIVLRPRTDPNADPGIESRRVDISFAP